jgi:hypothetical protein
LSGRLRERLDQFGRTALPLTRRGEQTEGGAQLSGFSRLVGVPSKPTPYVQQILDLTFGDFMAGMHV